MIIFKNGFVKTLSLLLGLIAGIFIAFNSVSIIVSSSNTEVPFNPTIIIDAGHGGFDGGATGVGGIVEKDINLSIAQKLGEYCELYGLEVIMTRETDIDISGKTSGKLSERKKADMMNRLKFTVDNPNSIFVSIHQNKFPQEKYWGTQVFYSTNNPSSEKLAQTIQSNIKKNIQLENKREIKEATKNLYLLYHSKVPAVIVECGFLSNNDEVAKLCDEQYQQKIAYCIFTSIAEYLN